MITIHPGEGVPSEAVNVLQGGLIAAISCGHAAPSWDDCAYALEETLRYLVQQNVIAIDPEQSHVVEIHDDHFRIKHPLKCRPALFECPYNDACQIIPDVIEDFPEAVGKRFRVTLEDGLLQIVDEAP